MHIGFLSKHSTKLLAVAVVLLITFALFSKAIKGGALKSVDLTVTVKIQERIDNSPRLRTARIVGEIMEGSSFLASPEVSVVAVLVLTAFVGFDRKKKRIRPAALAIPIFFVLLVGLEVYGKTVVHHPAPPFYMIKNPTTIFPKYYINDQFSYPSGHAARAVFLAIIIGSIVVKNIKKLTRKHMLVVGLLCGYVGLVCVSRIYLGHHWFSDILGGMILGTATAVGFVALEALLVRPAGVLSAHR